MIDNTIKENPVVSQGSPISNNNNGVANTVSKPLKNSVESTTSTPVDQDPPKMTQFESMVKGNINNAFSGYSTQDVTNTDFLAGNERLNGGENLEHIRGARQSSAAQIGKGVARIGTKVASEISKLPGYIGGLALTPMAAEGEGWETFVNNTWIKAVKDVEESVNDSLLEVYKTKKTEDGEGFENLWNNITSTSFWATEGADGIGFIVSMFAPGAIVKGLGVGGRVAGALASTTSKTANMLGKSVSEFQAMRGLTKLGVTKNAIDVGATSLANTLIESAAEAGGAMENYDETRFNLVFDKLAPKFEELRLLHQNGQLSDEEYENAYRSAYDEVANEFNEQKSLLGSNIFKSNLAILMGPNLLQSSLMYGSVKGGLTLNKPKLWNVGAKNLGLGIVSEGFWEEGSQTTVENYYTKKAEKFNLKGFIKDSDIGDMLDEYGETLTSSEGMKSIFLGAMLGGPMNAYHAVKHAKSNYQQSISLMGAAQGISANVNANLQKVYETDDNGDIVIDEKTGKPKLDISRTLSLLQSIGENTVFLNYVKNLTSEVQNENETSSATKEAYDLIQDYLLSTNASVMSLLDEDGSLAKQALSQSYQEMIDQVNNSDLEVNDKKRQVGTLESNRDLMMKAVENAVINRTTFDIMAESIDLDSVDTSSINETNKSKIKKEYIESIREQFVDNQAKIDILEKAKSKVEDKIRAIEKVTSTEDNAVINSLKQDLEFIDKALSERNKMNSDFFSNKEAIQKNIDNEFAPKFNKHKAKVAKVNKLNDKIEELNNAKTLEELEAVKNSDKDIDVEFNEKKAERKAQLEEELGIVREENATANKEEQQRKENERAQQEQVSEETKKRRREAKDVFDMFNEGIDPNLQAQYSDAEADWLSEQFDNDPLYEKTFDDYVLDRIGDYAELHKETSKVEEIVEEKTEEEVVKEEIIEEQLNEPEVISEQLYHYPTMNEIVDRVLSFKVSDFKADTVNNYAKINQLYDLFIDLSKLKRNYYVLLTEDVRKSIHDLEVNIFNNTGIYTVSNIGDKFNSNFKYDVYDKEGNKITDENLEDYYIVNEHKPQINYLDHLDTKANMKFESLNTYGSNTSYLLSKGSVTLVKPENGTLTADDLFFYEGPVQAYEDVITNEDLFSKSKPIEEEKTIENEVVDIPIESDLTEDNVSEEVPQPIESPLVQEQPTIEEVVEDVTEDYEDEIGGDDLTTTDEDVTHQNLEPNESDFPANADFLPRVIIYDNPEMTEWAETPYDKVGTKVTIRPSTKPFTNRIHFHDILHHYFNTGNISDAQKIDLVKYLHLEVNITTPEGKTITANLDSFKDNQALDAPNSYNANSASQAMLLRYLAVDAMLKNRTSDIDISTIVSKQFDGIFRQGKLNENGLFPGIQHLHIFKDMNKRNRKAYLRDNIFYSDSVTTKNKNTGEDIGKVGRPGDIFLRVPAANGRPRLVKVTQGKFPQHVTDGLYDFVDMLLSQQVNPFKFTIGQFLEMYQNDTAILEESFGAIVNDMKLASELYGENGSMIDMMNFFVHNSKHPKTRISLARVGTIELGSLFGKANENLLGFNDVFTNITPDGTYIITAEETGKVTPDGRTIFQEAFANYLNYLNRNIKANFLENENYLEYLMDNDLLTTNVTTERPIFGNSLNKKHGRWNNSFVEPLLENSIKVNGQQIIATDVLTPDLFRGAFPPHLVAQFEKFRKVREIPQAEPQIPVQTPVETVLETKEGVKRSDTTKVENALKNAESVLDTLLALPKPAKIKAALELMASVGVKKNAELLKNLGSSEEFLNAELTKYVKESETNKVLKDLLNKVCGF